MKWLSGKQVAERIKAICKNIQNTIVEDRGRYFTKPLTVEDVYTDYAWKLDQDEMCYRTVALCKADDVSLQFVLTIPLSLIYYDATLEGLYLEYVGTEMELKQKDVGVNLLETV